ncbi:MAG: GGDEF domain-containing protein [Burkholderiales bacterium]|nr:GGDEF domain-containing protein [Burkholderiales bacterium]
MARRPARLDQAASRRTPRRLWSLPAARMAHASPDELGAISQTTAELGWLLLVLALGYVALAQRALGDDAITAVLAAALVYAGALLMLRTLLPLAVRGAWPVLARCWVMIALVSWLLWRLGDAHGAALATLYYVVVVASAVALPGRWTLLNVVLIAACLIALARAGDPAQLLPGLLLFAQLGPMALVAYITTRVAGEIRQALERVRFISETDQLTGLYNLRAFMQIAERLHRQARRYTRPYALVMIDSDNLKSVNDSHGHECGNELLKLTTLAIRRELRETDVAARYGGDEFVLLLPETGAAGARELAERIRRAVAGKHLDVKGMRVATSVSVGIAAHPDHGSALRSILNKADQAMYLSKKTGRNRVTLFDPG